MDSSDYPKFCSKFIGKNYSCNSILAILFTDIEVDEQIGN